MNMSYFAMKMKKFAARAVMLFLVFLLTTPLSPASADPSLVFSGTPASGQYNSGLVSPTGTNEANVKMYYLASSAPTSRPKVGMIVRGEGFEPGRTVGFGVDPATTEPWSNTALPAGTPPATVEADGSFTYSMNFGRYTTSSYGKFSVEKLILYPKYLDDATADNDGRIPGVTLTLNITPTVVVLPRTLESVVLYTGTNYAFIDEYSDNGVARMIIDDSSRQVQLAVGGMTLRDDAGDLPGSNGTWSLPNGVTVSPNADSSYIVLRTPASGVGDSLNETLTVLGTGAAVVNDGFAAVAGFPKNTQTQIVTFNLRVTGSERSIRPKFDTVTFTNNEASSASIEFETTPPNLTVSAFQIVDPDTGEKVQALTTAGGLLIEPDAERQIPRVSFSGVPTVAGGSSQSSYNVVWTTNDGEELTAVINVNISTGSVYRPGYTTDIIGDGYPDFWQKGTPIEDVLREIHVRGADGSDVPVILEVDENGESFDGLSITANSDNKGIAISGTPNFAGMKTFYVHVSMDPSGGVSGTISPNRVPFTIFVDDAYYERSFAQETLNVPVGEKFAANINEITSPTYDRDIIPRDFEITGEGVVFDDSEYVWKWNGLSITSMMNVATWNCWIEISGEALEEGKTVLTLAPRRGSNMTSASMTIEAHKNEDVDTSEEPVVINEDKPVLVTSDDQQVVAPAPGETTKIVYILSDDVDINNYINVQTINMLLPDGNTVQLDHLNDNTVVDPFAGGVPNSYYVDRVNRTIVIYVTPETTGDYTYNVFFDDTTTLSKRPIVVKVEETSNNYETTTSGGGGCDAAGIGGFAAISLAAISLAASPRGKRGKRAK
ncbi:MAG: hypothetical protein LBQ42_06410 [Synergistaceae bacterium]|jgi:hypothetical protein|nr:hypothetical protein [Synergistaceae bacterium]